MFKSTNEKALANRERASVDRELELYRKEKKLAIDLELQVYAAERQAETVEMAKKCATQLGEYEHTFHFTKEQKGIELAKLEAKIENLEEIAKLREGVSQSYVQLLATKDAEIKRLNDLVILLVKEQPKGGVTLQQLK